MTLFETCSGTLLAVVLLGAASPALGAGSWRCGSRLVGAGQSVEDVYDLCGEPTNRAASTEFVTIHLRCGIDVTHAVQVENWIYNLGPKQFVRYLTFRDGTLVGIDEGSYGN
jgi:hypothetical protein